MSVYLFALVAFSVADTTVAMPGFQTIGYYATVAECQNDRNKIEKTMNKSYVRLDCVPLKVSD